MRKTKNTNYGLLQNALLEMSENDSQVSKELLTLTGSNPDELVISSMNAIDKHRLAFLARQSGQTEKDTLFDAVQAKIISLLGKSPEKTRSFLSVYFQQHSLPVQFGVQAGFDTNELSKVKEKLDLDDLSRKLDDSDSL